MEKIKNCYTVYLWDRDEKDKFERYAMNKEGMDNLKKDSIEWIKNNYPVMDEKMPILITEQEFRKSETLNIYTGSPDIINVYSHCLENKKNWVEVSQAIKMIESLTYRNPITW